MRAVKKINNNVAICVDGNGKELIAFGKGLGFQKMPYEITDLSAIDRTFYNISSNLLELIGELPDEIIEFSARMLNTINGLHYEYNQNVVLTLADHIEFALERKRKAITVRMPLVYEVRQKYPEEMKLGKYILRELNKTFHVELEPDEAVGIALNLVNARMEHSEQNDSLPNYEKEVVEEVTKIVEEKLGFEVDRNSFSYSRFATHLQYLIHRLNGSQCIDSDNRTLYQAVEEEYGQIAECVERIDQYFSENFNCTLTEEEKLYLILHINRVYAKEGL